MEHSPPLKSWPSQDQPREKLLLKGPQNLTDAELLAIFLRTGVKGCNVVELSRQLLSNFGSLQALFSASEQQFCEHKGLGKAKYVQLQACLEMSRRYINEELSQRSVLDSSIKTREYLISQLRHEPNEIFAVMLLNNQHQVLKFKRLFFGTIDAAAVYPRVVVETALVYKAAAVILCHNHPSGVAEASHADKAITERLVNALALVDVRVLDHMIVAGNKIVSFAEHGWLQ